MTALITVADVQAALSRYAITDTTVPSLDDVQGFIDEIDAEVHALVAGIGGTWPANTSTAAGVALKLTEIAGVKTAYLDTLFQLNKDAAIPSSLGRAAQEYKDRLGRLRQVVSGMENEPPAPAKRAPIAVQDPGGPAEGVPFDRWTQRRAVAAELRRPWDF